MATKNETGNGIFTGLDENRLVLRSTITLTIHRQAVYLKKIQPSRSRRTRTRRLRLPKSAKGGNRRRWGSIARQTRWPHAACAARPGFLWRLDWHTAQHAPKRSETPWRHSALRGSRPLKVRFCGGPASYLPPPLQCVSDGSDCLWRKWEANLAQLRVWRWERRGRPLVAFEAFFLLVVACTLVSLTHCSAPSRKINLV